MIAGAVDLLSQHNQESELDFSGTLRDASKRLQAAGQDLNTSGAALASLQNDLVATAGEHIQDTASNIGTAGVSLSGETLVGGEFGSAELRLVEGAIQAARDHYVRAANQVDFVAQGMAGASLVLWASWLQGIRGRQK